MAYRATAATGERSASTPSCSRANQLRESERRATIEGAEAMDIDLLHAFEQFLVTALSPLRWQGRLDDPGRPPGGLGEHASVLLTVALPATTSPDYEQDPTRSRSTVTIRVTVADRLAEGERRQLEAAGASYWDGSGRALIQHRSPDLWLRISRGERQSERETRSAYKDLRGEAIAEVLCAVLAARFVPSVHHLARQTGAGVATVSRALTLLRREGLLPETGSTMSDGIRRRLLRQWALQGGFAMRTDAHHYDGAGISEGRLRDAVERGVPISLSGPWAYQLYRGMEPSERDGNDLWLYTPAPGEVARELALKPDAAGGPVRIVQRGRRPTTSDRLVSGIPAVSPWRVAADLISAGGDHAALGDLLSQYIVDEECDLGIAIGTPF